MNEFDTCVVPYEPCEGAWARNRPLDERPAIPRPGDAVFYRHNTWDQQVDRAVVVEVQDLDDRADPNLWHLVRDVNGVPILDAGIPRTVRVADPWPWVILRTDSYGVVKTWESRLRGSAGWLPLNFRQRKIRLPHELMVQPLEPLNVPLRAQGG